MKRKFIIALCIVTIGIGLAAHTQIAQAQQEESNMQKPGGNLKENNSSKGMPAADSTSKNSSNVAMVTVAVAKISQSLKEIETNARDLRELGKQMDVAKSRNKIAAVVTMGSTAALILTQYFGARIESGSLRVTVQRTAIGMTATSLVFQGFSLYDAAKIKEEIDRKLFEYQELKSQYSYLITQLHAGLSWEEQQRVLNLIKAGQ